MGMHLVQRTYSAGDVKIGDRIQWRGSLREVERVVDGYTVHFADGTPEVTFSDGDPYEVSQDREPKQGLAVEAQESPSDT